MLSFLDRASAGSERGGASRGGGGLYGLGLNLFRCGLCGGQVERGRRSGKKREESGAGFARQQGTGSADKAPRVFILYCFGGAGSKSGKGSRSRSTFGAQLNGGENSALQNSF